MNDPVRLPLAETLATRYPAEPYAHYLLGEGLVWRGDFLAALPRLHRAVAMDSLGLRGSAEKCLACDALIGMIDAYKHSDSLAAAERTAREWLRVQPRSSRAWLAIFDVLSGPGRYAQALAALRRADSLHPGSFSFNQLASELAIREGDFATADRLLDALIRSTPGEAQLDGLWQLTLSLRYQGRLREALSAARRLRHLAEAVDTLLRTQPHYQSLMGAQVLFEMGRAREAAALFDSLASSVSETMPSEGTRARQRVWMLTHAATALAAAGDTARLRVLADSIEALGRRSAYGRDQRLHHHVRGLRFELLGLAAEAAASFGRALYSPYLYTRTNLHLGRALLATNRPPEAIAILRAALRGPLGATGLYATLTEFHELLGQAFEVAGEPDSAAVHYRWVLNAWRNADPEFTPRRAAVQARLAALKRA